MAATNKLSKTLLRGLLRAAARLDSTKASVAAELAQTALPLRPTAEASTFRSFVLSQFRANVAADGKGLVSLQNIAIQALATANQRATALATAQPSKPAEVAYSVGQVFRHRKYGYRGVIIGWDQSCKAGPQWIASTGVAHLPHGTQQPFYHVLIDSRDRAGAQVSYVAQDNIHMLTGSQGANVDPLARLVLHPLIGRYFAEYRPLDGYYAPNAALRSKYAADSPAVSVPVDSDEDSEEEAEEVAVSMLDLRTGSLVPTKAAAPTSGSESERSDDEARPSRKRTYSA